MITIDLNPSQYRVVHRSVKCSRECSSAVPVTARASRMSQATIPATPTTVPPATATPTTHHPIYGIVNLALLAVSIYLLWANF